MFVVNVCSYEFDLNERWKERALHWLLCFIWILILLCASARAREATTSQLNTYVLSHIFECNLNKWRAVMIVTSCPALNAHHTFVFARLLVLWWWLLLLWTFRLIFAFRSVYFPLTILNLMVNYLLQFDRCLWYLAVLIFSFFRFALSSSFCHHVLNRRIDDISGKNRNFGCIIAAYSINDNLFHQFWSNCTLKFEFNSNCLR